MRWVRLWFLLASVYLAARLVSAYWISGRLHADARLWLDTAAVAAVQVAVLAPLLLRCGRDARRSRS